jgi:hypothetical protein
VQAAREGAPYQRGKAQRVALLEQAEEEKKTGQQARLASIREQQASLAAEPLVRWLLTVPAEARVEPTEARLAATETLAPAEARREPTEAATGAEKAASAEAALDKPARPPDRLNEQFAVTSAVFVQEPGEPAELKEPKKPGEPAELKEPGEPAELKEPEKPGEPAELKEPGGPAELKEPMKPGEPAELKEPGGPAELKEPGEPAELKEPEKPGEPAELKEPEKPGEPAELKEPGRPAEPGEPRESAGLGEPEDPREPEDPGGPEGPGEPRGLAELRELQGMRRAREGDAAAGADTVRVRREAERFAGDAKMSPGNCLMEILALKENQEGIRIRRSPGNYVEHLPWVLKCVFPRTLCGPVNDEQGGCASSKVRGGDGRCMSSGVRQGGDPGGGPEPGANYEPACGKLPGVLDEIQMLDRARGARMPGPAVMRAQEVPGEQMTMATVASVGDQIQKTARLFNPHGSPLITLDGGENESVLKDIRKQSAVQ